MKNYTGDVLNFQMAADYEVRVEGGLVVNDASGARHI